MKSEILIPISTGELVDKITILQIKLQKTDDEDQLANIRRELTALEAVRNSCVDGSEVVQQLTTDLTGINLRLWNVEDEIRQCERDRDFGDRFIELARSVYHLNDERGRLKRQINTVTNSTLVEEKIYEDYE